MSKEENMAATNVILQAANIRPGDDHDWGSLAPVRLVFELLSLFDERIGKSRAPAVTEDEVPETCSGCRMPGSGRRAHTCGKLVPDENGVMRLPEDDNEGLTYPPVAAPRCGMVDDPTDTCGGCVRTPHADSFHIYANGYEWDGNSLDMDPLLQGLWLLHLEKEVPKAAARLREMLKTSK